MTHPIPFMKLNVKPKIPASLALLETLSYNLWSTWDKDAQRLFRRLDPKIFRQCDHNPVKLLHLVPEERLEELSSDRGFLYELEQVGEKFNSYLEYQGVYTDGSGKVRDIVGDHYIAYFSMEYGLHESIPAYSGGLGVLAGDYLKAASDQGIPLKAFGLLYKHGYFSQYINLEGMQHEEYKLIEWSTKPVRVLRKADGSEYRLAIAMTGRELQFRIWLIHVGRIELYLLDTDLPENPPDLRNITDILYDANRVTRIRQEILLALGGRKLMKELSFHPTIYHLNEGHSAFLILDRLRGLIVEGGHTLREAREIVYNSTVFTTHTPVKDGNEHFDREQVLHCLRWALDESGIPVDDFLSWGAIENDHANFWLPAFAIRFSRFVNGVSKLHCETSRQMWQKLYPQLYEKEVPIHAITNGVHIQSWASDQIISLFDRYIGPDYQHMAEQKAVWENIVTIPDSEVWEAHRQRKDQMISFIRTRVEESMIERGELVRTLRRTRNILHPEFLTIGFARRFAPYKRADLILEDPERLLNILRHPQKPVQFVFAGKAHPADDKGKRLIKRLIDFARENGVEDRFVFIEDYDINVARHIVQGVDVWLNNPIKPLEASGTSGMKAGMNGVLNLSVLDGWWPEAWNDINGWAINAGVSFSDVRMRRQMEANQIYEIIENEIREIFYDVDQTAIPREWVRRMKNSIFTIGMNFNMHRMLREYVDKFYVPGIENYEKLSENDFELMKKELAFEEAFTAQWERIQPLEIRTSGNSGQTLVTGSGIEISASVRFEEADHSLFTVEIFYDNGKDILFVPMDFQNLDEDGICHFSGILQVKGVGSQIVNVRIRPNSPHTGRLYRDYVRWFDVN